jgi:hypothetical protein
MKIFEKFPVVRRRTLAGLAAAGGLLLTSCARVGDSWVASASASAAKDQIMLVRESPPSFGYRRLITQMREYPHIAVFVGQRGIPDFLAETGSDARSYFIFYYLTERQAFACRTRPGVRSAVEFAGPYPITDREFRLLDGFRRDPSRRVTSF